MSEIPGAAREPAMAVRETPAAARETPVAVRDTAVVIRGPRVRDTVRDAAVHETAVRQVPVRDDLAPGEAAREPAAVPWEPVPTPP
ncbi:hypothetical protein [Streptomyces malaysiensis]|uniref:hypothetical protein n=1 Tax=Streptomyces malaysiensis TaxID=92644 RepID=UPI00163DE16B|nr:hypothetical protein [Streptomyces malaysiensis]